MAHSEKHREGAQHAQLIEAVSKSVEKNRIVRFSQFLILPPFSIFLFSVYRRTKRKKS